MDMLPTFVSLPCGYTAEAGSMDAPKATPPSAALVSLAMLLPTSIEQISAVATSAIERCRCTIESFVGDPRPLALPLTLGYKVRDGITSGLIRPRGSPRAPRAHPTVRRLLGAGSGCQRARRDRRLDCAGTICAVSAHPRTDSHVSLDLVFVRRCGAGHQLRSGGDLAL